MDSIRSFFGSKKSETLPPAKNNETPTQKKISSQAKNIPTATSAEPRSLPTPPRQMPQPNMRELKQNIANYNAANEKIAAADEKITAASRKILENRQNQLETIQSALNLLKNDIDKLDPACQEHQWYTSELSKLKPDFAARENELKMLLKNADLKDQTPHEVIAAKIYKLETIDTSIQIDKILEQHIEDLTHSITLLNNKALQFISKGGKFEDGQEMFEASIAQINGLKKLRSELPSIQEVIADEGKTKKLLSDVAKVAENSKLINNHISQILS